MSAKNATEQSYIDALSRLTLNPETSEEAYRFVAGLSDQERTELLSLADSNHVILRALKPIYEQAARAKNLPLAAWAENSMADERKRIANMLEHMERVCNGLEAAGCPTTVMKTLDHWPDIGNDIDMYSTAADDKIVEVMKRDFHAEVEPRSWGDRLAHKWNFALPGLKEPIEIHVRRLGQTGEHTDLAKRFVSRRQQKTIDGKTFWVPAPEERIVVATLQRMYRHFYFRLCDMADMAALLQRSACGIGDAQLRRAEAGERVCRHMAGSGDVPDDRLGVHRALSRSWARTAEASERWRALRRREGAGSRQVHPRSHHAARSGALHRAGHAHRAAWRRARNLPSAASAAARRRSSRSIQADWQRQRRLVTTVPLELYFLLKRE